MGPRATRLPPPGEAAGLPFAEVFSQVREQLVEGLAAGVSSTEEAPETSTDEAAQMSALAALLAPVAATPSAVPDAATSDETSTDSVVEVLVDAPGEALGSIAAPSEASAAPVEGEVPVPVAATETANDIEALVLPGETPAAAELPKSADGPRSADSVVVILDRLMPQAGKTAEPSSAEYRVVGPTPATPSQSPAPGAAADPAEANMTPALAAAPAEATAAVPTTASVSSASYEVSPSLATPPVAKVSQSLSETGSAAGPEPSEAKPGERTQPLVQVTPLAPPATEKSSAQAAAAEALARRVGIRASDLEVSTAVGLQKDRVERPAEEADAPESAQVSPAAPSSQAKGAEASASPALAGGPGASAPVSKTAAHKEARALEQPAPPLEVQAARGVRYLISEGGHSITVRLVPASLGEMHIEVRTEGSDMSIKLVSANPAVRDTLQSQVQGLRDALSREGIDVTKVEIASGMNQASSHGSFSGHHTAEQGTPARTPTSYGRSYGEARPERTEALRPVSAHSGSLNVFI